MLIILILYSISKEVKISHGEVQVLRAYVLLFKLMMGIITKITYEHRLTLHYNITKGEQSNAEFMQLEKKPVNVTSGQSASI